MIKKKPLNIAVIGGGIGGLTATLALQQAGLHAELYEQAPQFSEVGAGIGLGPNAVRILQRLGLGKQLDAIRAPVTGFVFRHWNDGKLINDQQQNAENEYIGGWPVHRAELITILYEAIPHERLHTGKHCQSLTQDTEHVYITFEDGTQVTADAVVGADGIHSVVRNTYHTDQPIFSNQIAYRGLVPMKRLTFLGDEAHKFTMWMGPQRHFLIYPVSRGTVMNVVAFVPPEGNWRVESWAAHGEVKDLAKEFDTWDPHVQKIIQAMDNTMRWALYDRDPLDFWTQGRVTLLGDAAHAMLPHQGQGAGQSIEDALILAYSLREADTETVSAWLQFYEALRKPRTTRVQETTRSAGKLYDLPDSEIYRRGESFSFSNRSTWLWNYDADQAFKQAMHTIAHP
ncbi:putative salicylate hydroxylase [Ktedonobacteria bacterium brp13]|nr:putative salicylate hydroxylase [Ktedonobacteria bacterium brp13]